MSVPRAIEAREYYRCAYQRYEEAQLLLRNKRTTGAVYLAGYSVECILKALVLTATAANRRLEVIGSFRGAKAHDYTWLRSSYRAEGGAELPRDVARQFSLVEVWSTNLRYTPRAIRPPDALAFVRAAGVIVQWGNGRL